MVARSSARHSEISASAAAAIDVRRGESCTCSFATAHTILTRLYKLNSQLRVIAGEDIALISGPDANAKWDQAQDGLAIFQGVKSQIFRSEAAAIADSRGPSP